MKQKRLLIFKQLKIRKDNPNCILIFDPENDLFYELNDIGSEIFLLIEKKLLSNTILKKLKERYKALPSEIEKEFNSFIKRLIKLKIVYEKK